MSGPLAGSIRVSAQLSTIIAIPRVASHTTPTLYRWFRAVRSEGKDGLVTTGPSRRAVRLVLVHGTFAPRSRWTFPDSALSREPRRRVPGAIIERIQWSGANLHRSRPRVHLITVGTPYLRWEEHRHGHSVADQPTFGLNRLLWLALAGASGAPVLIGLTRLGLEPSDPATADDPSTWVPLNRFSSPLGELTDAAVSSLVLPLLAVTVALTVVSALLVRFGTPPGLEGISGGEVATRITTIRTRDDEAAGRLYAGRLLTDLVRLVRLVTDRIPSGLALVTLAFAAWIGVAFVQGGEAGLSADPRLRATAWMLVLMVTNTFSVPWGAEVVSLLAAVLATCGALGLILGVATVLEALACGFDGVPLLAHGRVGIDPKPPGGTAPAIVELEPRPGVIGPRHARLMNDPNSIDAIAEACLAARRSMQLGESG